MLLRSCPSKNREMFGSLLGMDDFQLPPAKDHCHHCGTEAANKHSSFKKCSRCFSVFYCSTKCQRASWKVHKKDCVPLSVVKDSIVALFQEYDAKKSIQNIKLAVDVALPLCRYDKQRTLFLLKFIPLGLPFILHQNVISVQDLQIMLSARNLTTAIMLQLSDTLGGESDVRQSIVILLAEKGGMLSICFSL
jgi:hypothetical protein